MSGSTRKASSARKAPTEAAALLPNYTIRVGNDGKEWGTKEDKNGVRRWVRPAPPRYSARYLKLGYNPKWQGGIYRG